MSDLKPVVFKIVLDTADAQKALDALSKGGGKGTADGKGVPQAPKPTPGGAGAVPGERGGVKAPTPGTGSAGALGMARGAASSIGGGVAGAGFGSALGGINRAILDPVGAAERGAIGAVGTGLGAAAAVAGIIVTSAVFLEQVVPLILESLADSLPDMPFFKEYVREFDDMVSDRITELRTWIAAIIPTISETASIDRAILQSGGTLNAENTLELGKSLFEVNRQVKRFDADVEKEIDKVVFKGLIKSLAAGMGG